MPPHILLRGITFFFLFGSFAFLAAQPDLSLVALGTVDSIAVTGYAGDPEESPAVIRADWTGLDGTAPRFKLHTLAEMDDGREVALNELILSAVDQYLDQRVHFTRNGVKTDVPIDRLNNDVDRMIALTAAYFEGPTVVLSEASRKQMQRVCSIDWSQASFGVDGGDDLEKYLAISFYVRAQRQELERQLRNDLLPLSSMRVGPSGAGVSSQPTGIDLVPTVCNSVFDEDNFLCALDLRADGEETNSDVQLTNAMLSEIAAKAETLQHKVQEPKLRKRDRWLKTELDAINRRIDQGDQRKELWALRDRMDDIEDRLDNISLQVDDLNNGYGSFGTVENPVANLSALTGKNVQVHFPAGSSELDGKSQGLLEEVANSMRSTREGRVLVTGFADPSGSPALNLALSEKRAKAVRSYLLQRGVSGDRLLLNYYGASQSTGTGAGERRVELEWIR